MKHVSIDKDIFVTSLLTVLALILALIVPANWLFIRILTLPLILLIPGYALTSVLFPNHVLGFVEHIAFIIGLSLSTVVLGGLLLNFTPLGLSSISFAVLLGSITLIACILALVLRRRQNATASGWPKIGKLELTFSQGLLLSLATLIVCGAITVSLIGAEQQPRSGFTQLWILPTGGSNINNAVRLGVSNMEQRPMGYRLDVNVNGKKVKEWLLIRLNSNKQWEVTFVLPLTGKVSNVEVEADLYRVDAPTKIYRHVVLWLGS